MGWHVPYIDQAERQRFLEEYRRYLEALDDQRPLRLPSLSEFDSLRRPPGEADINPFGLLKL